MSTTGIIITIDGPAGSGKSTAARLLAERLGMEYLDTGGMYRAAALLGLRNNIDWDRPDQLTELVRNHRIEGRQSRTLLDGEDVTDEVRTPRVTQYTRYSADNPDVRAMMVDLQRKAAKDRLIVTEGRDQGSVVFPDAFCKFYLTATPEVRAQRRFAEQSDRQTPETYDDVLRKIVVRDDEDRRRPVGPLTRPCDAISIDSDGLSIEQVVSLMEHHINSLGTLPRSGK